MKTQYLVRRVATQIIDCAVILDNLDPTFIGPVDPEHPGPTITPQWEPGCELIEWAGDTNLSGGTTPTSVLEWSGSAPVWVERGNIAVQRTHKASAISSFCADAILAGFVSSALGEPHTYPANRDDQTNLLGSILDSFMPGIAADWSTPFWCASGEVWAYRMHSAAQIQQVGRDAKAANLTHRSINEQLQAQIIAAENPADLANINWPV